MALTSSPPRTPFGFNAALGYINRDNFIPLMQGYDPSVIVAMVDKDEYIPQIEALPPQLPRTTIIARVHHSIDQGFHLDGPNMENDPTKKYRGWAARPVDFMNKWGRLADPNKGMSLYAMNEPSGEMPPDVIERKSDWLMASLEIATSRGQSLTVDNSGVGHPLIFQAPAKYNHIYHSMWDPRYDDLLKYLSKHREHFLGFHEYLPEAGGGRIGRFLAMIVRCMILGIDPPRFVFTEFGVDENGTKTNGWKSRGWSESFYINELNRIINSFYMPYIVSGHCLGTAVFQLNRMWPAFNVDENETEFHKYLRTHLIAWPQIIVPPTKPPVEEPPTVPPTVPVPSVLEPDEKNIHQLITTLSEMYSTLPNVSAQEVAQFKSITGHLENMVLSRPTKRNLAKIKS